MKDTCPILHEFQQQVSDHLCTLSQSCMVSTHSGLPAGAHIESYTLPSCIPPYTTPTDVWLQPSTTRHAMEGLIQAHPVRDYIETSWNMVCDFSSVRHLRTWYLIMTLDRAQEKQVPWAIEVSDDSLPPPPGSSSQNMATKTPAVKSVCVLFFSILINLSLSSSAYSWSLSGQWWYQRSSCWSGCISILQCSCLAFLA